MPALRRCGPDADFYPRPPRGGRQRASAGRQETTRFLSTPSARRATAVRNAAAVDIRISIHALREEGDLIFYHHGCNIEPYFYPRPPRGGRRGRLHPRLSLLDISIHALREEGDIVVWLHCQPFWISIHALREEGDCWLRGTCPPHPISIHALREEGDGDRFLLRHTAGISIHALREEGDRGRADAALLRSISIHALREEGDSRSPPTMELLQHFYPRPPRGGRRTGISGLCSMWQFLSTPSARRATHWFCRKPFRANISIHALREEGDASDVVKSSSGEGFLSTPSARRATMMINSEASANGISIHALREEGDGKR